MAHALSLVSRTFRIAHPADADSDSDDVIVFFESWESGFWRSDASGLVLGDYRRRIQHEHNRETCTPVNALVRRISCPNPRTTPLDPHLSLPNILTCRTQAVRRETRPNLSEL